MEGGIRDSATLPGTSNINVWAKISNFHHGKDYEEFKFINVQCTKGYLDCGIVWFFVV